MTKGKVLLIGGEVMGYFNPQINDSGWIKTKTYSTTWDAQGLGNLHDGEQCQLRGMSGA